MATTRELKNKIRSTKNTKKITRTMEMISTAKARVCQKRIEAAQPYGNKLAEILRDLRRGEVESSQFPLLRVPATTKREALFVITGNRGLCGGYNTNTLKMAERYIERRRAEGVEVEVHMAGKKGIARFRYTRREIKSRYTQFDDKVSFALAEQALEPILERYAAGELDAVTMIFTHYVNSARQVPVERQLLPIPASNPETKTEKQASEGLGARVDFIFEPDPKTILESLLPLSLKTQFFQAFLEATTSEQIARRIAMKNATESADDMARMYTQLYNRTRQAGITQELLEVIGGAENLA